MTDMATKDDASIVTASPVTIPCAICGLAITVTPLPPQFGLYLPRSIAHEECIKADKERRERTAREQAIDAAKADVNALRADLPGAMARCGVPSHYLTASFAACCDLPSELVDAARRWASNPNGILYLHGLPGSGKTWLAVAILRSILANGICRPAACRCMSEHDYLGGIKAGFGEGTDEPRRVLPSNHPLRAQVLLYDDLAAVRQTDWTRGEIAKLVEIRHADDLPTIITSNVAPGSIAQAIDGRVASRIAEYRMMLEFPRRDLRVSGTRREINDSR